jgi:hypothetical protein
LAPCEAESADFCVGWIFTSILKAVLQHTGRANAKDVIVHFDKAGGDVAKYIHVFAGRTPEDEWIILYKNVNVESELHIQRPDGELWALSPGSEVCMRFELDTQLLHLYVKSPEWTGSAKGSKEDLLYAEAR